MALNFRLKTYDWVEMHWYVEYLIEKLSSRRIKPPDRLQKLSKFQFELGFVVAI